MPASILDRLSSLFVRDHPVPRDGRLALMIDHRFPDPTRDSGSMDTVNYIAWLRGLGYEVCFLSLSEHHQHRRRGLHARRAGAHIVTPSEAPDITAWLEAAAARFEIHFLSRITHGGAHAARLRAHAPDALQIFNTVDLHHLRELRQAEISGDAKAMAAADTMRDRELALVAATDATIVVSEHEAALLRETCPDARVWVMPLFRPVADTVPGFDARTGLGFVAGFAHPPNLDAVQFFLNEVWPHVARKDPDLRFSIVGMGLPDEIARALPSNVRYLGHVADLEAWLDGLRMTVAPLRFGSGAKGKVASSVSNGVPVVGTAVAFEGMGLPEAAYRAAETPEAMAEAIVALHADRTAWDSASNSGHAFAKATLSPDAGARRFAAFLGELQPTQTP